MTHPPKRSIAPALPGFARLDDEVLGVAGRAARAEESGDRSSRKRRRRVNGERITPPRDSITRGSTAGAVRHRSGSRPTGGTVCCQIIPQLLQ
jgi:hypothetical protein